MQRMLIFLFLFTAGVSYAQEKLHGSFEEERSGVHNGNRIQTTFYNSGLVGRVGNKPEDIGGE